MELGDLHEGAKGKLFRFARSNRKTATDAEDLLWKNLRGRRLDGFKFRRQHPILHYIADFYCYECKLIVEVDGSFHFTPEQATYDQRRTKELESCGIKVLRFPNDQVLKNMSAVRKEIAKHLSSRRGLSLL